ncbi:secretin N-terminal domain-containing protein [Methyloversatilis sp.]|uniref:secretin N-terminal domain-containing protein n=1 Tax=Methyloversatilis sp. TaxID=2569862 RepID=UPI002733AE59|nr:secretin N-terminal domain-containing protein [Methyloversatilis sp.]MDP2869121.1 secretin and TonB N-terminal domain-containing protein [Methyloversatilis sp.]MDP3454415.1 secretin and TonB N-terminal domain-containing protein [Methyloversatilis sp.]MDP3577565.1 secretin and TonB N-terminal domain-containing protein [Methyloversatilis sp.]
MIAFQPARLRALIFAFLAVTLAGCAANQAFEDGKKALISGEQERALSLFEQATREVPDNPEFRATFFRQREVAVSKLLAQAENARLAGRRDEVTAALDKAQTLDPRNQRAQFIRDQMTRGVRHDAMVREARTLLERKDMGGAEARLRNVLEQDNTHSAAREMLREVEQARPKQTAPAELGGLFQKPVTLEFRDTSLRNVFEAIARSTGINFVFDKDVRSDLKVTLFVRNTTVAEVMRLILITNQLERSVLSDNTVLIYPNTAAKQREYKEMVTRTFFLVNAEAKQVQNLIKTVVKTKDIYIDERINLIVMKDTADAVRLAEQLVESVDVAEPEVMLEVEVLEVSSNKLKELGLDFPDQIGFGALRSQQQVIQQSTAAGVTSNVVQLPGQEIAPGVVPLSDISDLTGYISNPGLILNLRKQDGSANLLANPRIRVKNKEKAKVHIGEKLPVFTTTSTANVGVSASVTYLDVGLKLDVEPLIHLEDDVDIKMTLEVSSVVREVQGPQSSLAYQIGTRSTATALRLKDGETQILAGLISDEERSSASRLPGLGDLPIIGKLFSSERNSTNKTEIVLLITPRIVRNLNRPAHIMPALAAGTEAAVGAPSLSVRKTGKDQGMRLSSSSGGGAAAAAAPIARPVVPEPPDPGPGDEPADASAQVELRMQSTGDAAIGGEASVSVSMTVPVGAQPATVELVYDPNVLTAQGNVTAPGRTTVSIAGSDGQEARSEVRFRVSPTAPIGSTSVQVGSVTLLGADGNPLPVSPPSAAEISIKP